MNVMQHTAFQCRHFIVGKEVTLWGQYRQVLRELEARNKKPVNDAEVMVFGCIKAELEAAGANDGLLESENAEVQYWETQLFRKAVCEIVSTGTFSDSTVDFALSFPAPARRMLVECLMKARAAFHAGQNILPLVDSPGARLALIEPEKQNGVALRLAKVEA